MNQSVVNLSTIRENRRQSTGGGEERGDYRFKMNEFV
jgi:hypothetical protein